MKTLLQIAIKNKDLIVSKNPCKGILSLFLQAIENKDENKIKKLIGDNYYWLLDNKLNHLIPDGGYENYYGDKLWYKNNKLHREDGPEIEHANGTKYWYENGKFHKETMT